MIKFANYFNISQDKIIKLFIKYIKMKKKIITNLLMKFINITLYFENQMKELNLLYLQL